MIRTITNANESTPYKLLPGCEVVPQGSGTQRARPFCLADGREMPAIRWEL